MDTKREILATALDLFSRAGYEAVGVQQICTSAGITKPSLYYHFSNKETLLGEVAGDAAVRFLHALVNGPTTGIDTASREVRFSGDLVADIRSLFASVLWFSRTHPARFQIILQMLYPPPGSVLGQIGKPELNRIYASLAQFFTSAATAHGNLVGKERFLAIVFVGHAIALAMFLSNIHDPPNPDSPEVVQAAQTFLYGVF
ncbi:MAG: TetR/AcrR family transcriptional regulator [Alkalispirochaeta sp.]